MKTIQQIYEAQSKGDFLTDDELSVGIAAFQNLTYAAESAGPVFELAASEARRVVSKLRSFRDARKRA